jgi:hypothetical protein
MAVNLPSPRPGAARGNSGGLMVPGSRIDLVTGRVMLIILVCVFRIRNDILLIFLYSCLDSGEKPRLDGCHGQ